MALRAEDMIWQMRRDPRIVPSARDLPSGIFVDPSVKDIWGRGYGGALMSRTPNADWASVGAPRTVARESQWQTANPATMPILVRDPADIGAAMSPWIGRNDQVELGNIGRANAAEQLANNWNLMRLQMRREDQANAQRMAAAAEAQNIADERWNIERRDRSAYEDKYFKEREADRIARQRESMTNEGLKMEADAIAANAKAAADAKAADEKAETLWGEQKRLFNAAMEKINIKTPIASMSPDQYAEVVNRVRAEVAAKTHADYGSTSNWPGTGAASTGVSGRAAPNTSSATTTQRPTLEQFNAASQKAMERAIREGKDIRAVKREIANRAKAFGFMPPKDWE